MEMPFLTDPLVSFQEFLTQDYPRLRKIIRDAGAEDIFLVTENEFKSMFDRVEQIRARK